MKNSPIFMDLDDKPLFQPFNPADNKENMFANLPSTEEMLKQQETATNRVFLFLNRKNESNQQLIQFAGKNNIMVMFSLHNSEDAVSVLSKESDKLLNPINRTDLQKLLIDKSPAPLDNAQLEEVLNNVYSPVLSKTNFLDRVKSTKLDIFIDDNPGHINPWKNK